jgi:hypothetical protein
MEKLAKKKLVKNTDENEEERPDPNLSKLQGLLGARRAS